MGGGGRKWPFFRGFPFSTKDIFSSGMTVDFNYNFMLFFGVGDPLYLKLPAPPPSELSYVVFISPTPHFLVTRPCLHVTQKINWKPRIVEFISPPKNLLRHHEKLIKYGVVTNFSEAKCNEPNLKVNIKLQLGSEYPTPKIWKHDIGTKSMQNNV